MFVTHAEEKIGKGKENISFTREGNMTTLTQVWRVRLILVSLPQNESKGAYHHCIYLNIAPSQSQNATSFFFLINQKCLSSQTIACFQANFFNLPQTPFPPPLDPG